MADDSPAPMPVTLLTGFLGSGKTTLLRRLLADPRFGDAAVVINEFGEVGLDHHLVQRLDEEVVLLNSGCVCCTVRGELADTLRDLLSRRARGALSPFRRIVIESTGLADPFPVVSTLSADPILRHHVRSAGIVATVDAVNGAAHLDRHAESVRQAAIADVLVLTKTDLADAAQVERLVRRLRRINPDAPILHGVDDDLDLDVLVGSDGRSWFKATMETASPPAHRGDVQAVTIVANDPVDWTSFGFWLTMLLNRHGGDILRVKGILALEGENRPVAVHGVQHLVHAPTHLPAWPDADRRSRLVFIVDGIEPDAIRRSFATFNRLRSRTADARR